MNTQEEETAVTTVEKSQQESKVSSPVLVEAEKMFEKLADITKETMRKAYEFFQRRGGEFGKELDDWFNAEAKVLRPVPVEITETDGTFDVAAAVPGFRPEEIEISVKEDLLIMSGETAKQQEKEVGNVVYRDWESNRFFRRLRLPSAVDADNVKAELKDGILRLSLPKAAVKEPERIAVRAA